jgi:hypothetical protein
MSEHTHETALKARTDLHKYGENARLLFALETRFGIDDIDTVAIDALTGGSDDKGCDLVYVDRDGGCAVIAQAYHSSKRRQVAPANKATSLNTAISWLLAKPINQLPQSLVSAARDLRSALDDNELRQIHIWYVHNLPESPNCRKELDTVGHSLKSALKARFPKAELEDIGSVEVGLSTLEDWYLSLETPILVTDKMTIEVPGSYEMTGDNWTSLVTSVPAKWLHDLWRQHGANLFSANVRDYLGSRRSNRNVNHNIKQTASESSKRFWVYNNGITAIVGDYQIDDTLVTLEGLSIVNGAQTTGAIGSLSASPDADTFVQARFVKCSDVKTIQSIIQYNNTQNVVKVTDFRSNDQIQRRLRTEFSRIPETKYLGGRRGGDEDVIRRPTDLLPTDTCSQALAAFHQEPGMAYHRKSEMWEDDGLYSRFFSEHTTATHIVFTYSLLRAVEDAKRTLLQTKKPTEQQSKQIEFVRNRGATFLAVAAIASCIEAILGKPVPSKWKLSFSRKSPNDAIGFWKPIVAAMLPLCAVLETALATVLKRREETSSAIGQFQALVEATKVGNAALFDDFAKRVHLSD